MGKAFRYKLKLWWARYKYPELIATFVFFLIHFLAIDTFEHGLFYTYLMTVVEYCAYYSVVLWQRCYRSSKRSSRFIQPMQIIGNILLEFGPASVLDFMIIRPTCLFICAQTLELGFWNVVVGSCIADVIFYAMAICCWENFVQGREVVPAH